MCSRSALSLQSAGLLAPNARTVRGFVASIFLGFFSRLLVFLEAIVSLLRSDSPFRRAVCRCNKIRVAAERDLKCSFFRLWGASSGSFPRLKLESFQAVNTQPGRCSPQCGNQALPLGAILVFARSRSNGRNLISGWKNLNVQADVARAIAALYSLEFVRTKRRIPTHWVVGLESWANPCLRQPLHGPSVSANSW